MPETTSPFHDLHDYAALPRIGALVLSPDGSRLVATVQHLGADRAHYETHLWDVDPAGRRTARRTDLPSPVKSSVSFAGDGSLLFTAANPDPDVETTKPALWRLDPSGEHEPIAAAAAGLSGPLGARAAAAYLVATSRLANADEAADRRWREERDTAKITAILHEGFPVRHWDRELGPDFPRLLAGNIDGSTPPQDLTPDAGAALVDAKYAMSPDGTVAVTTWLVRDAHGTTRTSLVAVEMEDGVRRTLADEPGVQHTQPVCSPDSRFVAALRKEEGTFAAPPTSTICVHDLKGGPSRIYRVDDELSATEYAWTPDSTVLYVAGDLGGRGAVIALDVATGHSRLIASDAVYSWLSISPDGANLYALRSAIDSPPQPVRLDLDATNGTPTYLPSPAPTPQLPGTMIRVEANAEDGATVGGWLVLPHETNRPAPLQQWIHGGPLASYNKWSWTRCPWIAAARGWAVLMPDPALSTGYGQRWIERAWPDQARLVWRDVETLLDAVVMRVDIDADRTACVGSSFGGYMANWIAGHTDRFKAIVSHAGIWAADQRHSTSDMAATFTRWFGTPLEHPDWYRENSPHHSVDKISTPMLITHGNRDFRVPMSEGLRAFWDVVSHHDGPPATMPHRFLQFETENHFILSPGNARVWNETMLAFLDRHVLDADWSPPRELTGERPCGARPL